MKPGRLMDASSRVLVADDIAEQLRRLPAHEAIAVGAGALALVIQAIPSHEARAAMVREATWLLGRVTGTAAP